MNKEFVHTDTFVLKKHNLRIYRVAERNTAILLWTTEQQAVSYVQKLHMQKLMVKKGFVSRIK